MEQTQTTETQQDDNQRAAQFAELLTRAAAREVPRSKRVEEHATDDGS